MRFHATAFIASCALCLTALADENPPEQPHSTGNQAIQSVISKFDRNLTFYAAFDGTPNASMSNGSYEPTAQKDIKYSPGKSGEALSNGTAVFPGQENLDSLAGTAILWVEIYRPAQVAEDEGYFFPLMMGINDDAKKSYGTFIIGKMHNSLIYSYFQEGAGGPGNITKLVHPYVGSLGWKKGEWHLLAFAWKPGCIQLSIDGQPFVKNSTMPPIAGKATHITVTALSPEEAKAAVAVDEVMVFNRPLSDEEISWIWNTMGKLEPLH